MKTQIYNKIRHLCISDIAAEHAAEEIEKLYKERSEKGLKAIAEISRNIDPEVQIFNRVNFSEPEENTTFPIDLLDISVRCYQLLKQNGIEYLNDLCNYRKEDLKKFKNFGSKSLEELDNVMTQYGLKWLQVP